jgi:tetratricopeptide (TPR) repeat protein
VRFYCAALYLLLAWLYAPSLAYRPISLDDDAQLRYVSEAAAAGARPAAWGFDQFEHFRPIKNAVFAAVAQAGDEVLAWRVAIAVVFLVIVALVQRYATQLSGSSSVGLAAAACWSLHPTTASIVCWLSAANIGLCALGVLVYAQHGQRVARAQPSGFTAGMHTAVALAALTFALGCHELALVAPLVLLVYRRLWAREVPARGARPLLVGSILLCAGYLAIQAFAQVDRVGYRAAEQPGWLLSASAMRYFADNTLLWLLPWGRFGVLWTDAPAGYLVASGLWWTAALGAGWFAYRLRDHDRVAAFGLGWFAIFLLPHCNLLPLGNTPVAQHYLFIPAIGLAIAISSAGARLLGRVPQARHRVAIGALLTAAICAAFAVETRRAVAAWGDTEQLYARTLANYPDNVEALVNLSAVYVQRAAYDRAQPLLTRARRLAPHDLGVLRNQFTVLWQTEQARAALALLDSAPEVAEQPEFLLRKGMALEHVGRLHEAATTFESAFARTRAPEERFSAGCYLIAVLLRIDQRARAAAVLRALLVEFPDRSELGPLRELL